VFIQVDEHGVPLYSAYDEAGLPTHKHVRTAVQHAYARAHVSRRTERK
jgi:hypothetical protein